MSPRSPHALLCFLVSMGFSQAAEFNWTDHGTIDLDTPPDWKLRGSATEDGSYTFVASPRAETHAMLQISVLSVPPALVLTDNDLRLRLHDSLRTYIDQSVEKEFRLQDLACRQGKGWYADLTDAALASQPGTQPEEFRVMRSALLLLEPQTLVVATMLFDDARMPEAATMLKMVASMRFARHPANGPGSVAASPTGPR